MPDRNPRDYVGLGVGTWNTHMGHAMEAGGLGFLLRRFPAVRLWSLQEVPSLASIVKALHAADAFHDWQIVFGERRGTPALLVWDRRFTVLDAGHPPLTPAMHNRDRTWAQLRDHRSRRDVFLSGLHIDPLGKGLVDANPHARQLHMGQAQAYADAAARRPAGAVVIDAGDGNERLDRPLPPEWRDRSLEGRYRAAGLRAACRLAPDGQRAVGLDDVFVRTDGYVNVRSRVRVDVPVPGNDHPAVVVRFGIRRAPK